MTHAIDKENRVSRNSTDTLQRQWHMLRMIPRAPRHITAGELCEGLAQRGIRAGKRTIERDLQNLLGTFPLEVDETARPFLWSWHKDANFDFMPRLSVPQGMALLLAQQHLKTLLPAATQRELQPLFQMARRELAAGVWKDWHQRTAVQPSVKTLLAPELDADVLGDVHEALALRRQLSAIYRSKGAREGRRALIHPLGLIIRGQVHYLACTFDGYQDIRQLALHRLSETQVQAAACVVPQDFDFAVYADRAGRYEDQGTVRLMARFTSAAAEHLRETPLSADQALHELADGAQVDVVATVSLDQPLRWWLRGFGSQVEVLEPASLRAEMQADVQLLAATYADTALPAARSSNNIA